MACLSVHRCHLNGLSVCPWTGHLHGLSVSPETCHFDDLSVSKGQTKDLDECGAVIQPSFIGV